MSRDNYACLGHGNDGGCVAIGETGTIVGDGHSVSGQDIQLHINLRHDVFVGIK
jgi:hypothetical protein